MDINPWFKATAGPVAGVTTFGVANATATKYIVPSIKQANIIGNVESNRSITEIAKTDMEKFRYEFAYRKKSKISFLMSQFRQTDINLIIIFQMEVLKVLKVEKEIMILLLQKIMN